jgi:hypothetical protein
VLEIPSKPFLYSPSTSSTHLASEKLWLVWILRCNAEFVALKKNVIIWFIYESVVIMYPHYCISFFRGQLLLLTDKYFESMKILEKELLWDV